jgi:predicted TIM-barrel fold metal-dependent hydrolase
MIIDCHCHAGRSETFSGPWDVASLERYLRRARAAGISRTVLFPTLQDDYAAGNRQVARFVSSRPERFIGFAMVNPVRDRGRIEELVATAVRRWGFRGIKVHRHDGRLTREVCEVARRFRLPVLYDVAGQVESVELFAGEYPQVNFIIPHLGSFTDDWGAQLALIDHLRRHPNVYADTSGVRWFDLLRAAVQRAGAHKVLFGSDGPWLHPGVELAKVRALDLPPAAQARIVGGNIQRLLGPARRVDPSPCGGPTRWRRTVVSVAGGVGGAF